MRLAFWSLPFVIHPPGIVITSAIEHDGLITTAIKHNGGRCLSFNIAMGFHHFTSPTPSMLIICRIAVFSIKSTLLSYPFGPRFLLFTVYNTKDLIKKLLIRCSNGFSGHWTKYNARALSLGRLRACGRRWRVRAPRFSNVEPHQIETCLGIFLSFPVENRNSLAWVLPTLSPCPTYSVSQARLGKTWGPV